MAAVAASFAATTRRRNSPSPLRTVASVSYWTTADYPEPPERLPTRNYRKARRGGCGREWTFEFPGRGEAWKARHAPPASGGVGHQRVSPHSPPACLRRVGTHAPADAYRAFPTGVPPRGGHPDFTSRPCQYGQLPFPPPPPSIPPPPISPPICPNDEVLPSVPSPAGRRHGHSRRRHRRGRGWQRPRPRGEALLLARDAPAREHHVATTVLYTFCRRCRDNVWRVGTSLLHSRCT